MDLCVYRPIFLFKISSFVFCSLVKSIVILNRVYDINLGIVFKRWRSSEAKGS
jgi:hypothetical protein